ncbi:MAG: ABC transporter permease [Thermoproteales archaeon]|nr:ABC transporter permease [Thermoproteales archaeon]RLE65503.1 MAG: ABC transporter substrate-binding protein [Thermoprotei archaeon]
MNFLDEVIQIVFRSLMVSGLATILATLWSIPISLFLLTTDFKYRGIVQDIFNSLVSIPTVVLGLFLYILLSRFGPLGFLGLLYTPIAISIGQAILITPLMVSVITTSLRRLKGGVWETAISLGATRLQASIVLLDEGLAQLVRSMLIGFNRAIGELGVALMVGGNIRGFTRVMTTAIALEVTRGNFELALNLGAIFLIITGTLTVVVRILGVRE